MKGSELNESIRRTVFFMALTDSFIYLTLKSLPIYFTNFNVHKVTSSYRFLKKLGMDILLKHCSKFEQTA